MLLLSRQTFGLQYCLLIVCEDLCYKKNTVGLSSKFYLYKQVCKGRVGGKSWAEAQSGKSTVAILL